MRRRPPRSTRTDTLCPYTTLFRSAPLKAVHTAKGEYSERGHSAQKRGSMDIKTAGDDVPSFEHPVVRTHPETGRKALYVNPAFTEKFVGMTRRESLPLLKFLFDHCTQEGFTCRFRWTAGAQIGRAHL